METLFVPLYFLLQHFLPLAPPLLFLSRLCLVLRFPMWEVLTLTAGSYFGTKMLHLTFVLSSQGDLGLFCWFPFRKDVSIGGREEFHFLQMAAHTCAKGAQAQGMAGEERVTPFLLYNAQLCNWDYLESHCGTQFKEPGQELAR